MLGGGGDFPVFFPHGFLLGKTGNLGSSCTLRSAEVNQLSPQWSRGFAMKPSCVHSGKRDIAREKMISY